MTRRHDRKWIEWQGGLWALFSLFLVPSALGEGDPARRNVDIQVYSPNQGSVEDGKPLRFGDPEVVWEEEVPDSSPKEKKTSKISSPKRAKPSMPATQTFKNASGIREMIDSVPPDQDFSLVLERIDAGGASAVPVLAEVFLDPSARWQSRWIAAMALSRADSKDSRAALQKGLQDSFFLVRMAALVALGASREGDVAPAVRRSLNDKAMVVRSAAVDALGKLRDEGSVPALLEELWAARNFHRGRSLWIRKHILVSLGRIGDASVLPSVIKVFGDHDSELRLEACRTLSRLQPEVEHASETPREGCADQWLSWFKTFEEKSSPTSIE